MQLLIVCFRSLMNLVRAPLSSVVQVSSMERVDFCLVRRYVLLCHPNSGFHGFSTCPYGVGEVGEWGGWSCGIKL